MKAMNSGKGKPPLYPCRRKEKVIQVLIRPSRKRKAEYDHVTVVKRPRRCNRKRKREDNITILTPFKRTRLDEDQAMMLQILYALMLQILYASMIQTLFALMLQILNASMLQIVFVMTLLTFKQKSSPHT